MENAKAYDGSRSLGYYAKQVGARKVGGTLPIDRHDAIAGDDTRGSGSG
jgi:hypothetical protein